jgi:hypothetical protein
VPENKHQPKTYFITTMYDLAGIRQSYPEWEDFRPETQEKLANLLGSMEEAYNFYRTNKQSFIHKGAENNWFNSIKNKFVTTPESLILNEYKFFNHTRKQQANDIKKYELEAIKEICKTYGEDPKPVIKNLTNFKKELRTPDFNIVSKTIDQVLEDAEISLSEESIDLLKTLARSSVNDGNYEDLLVLHDLDIDFLAKAHELSPEITRKLKVAFCSENGPRLDVDTMKATMYNCWAPSNVPIQDLERLQIDMYKLKLGSIAELEGSSALNNPSFHIIITNYIDSRGYVKDAYQELFPKLSSATNVDFLDSKAFEAPPTIQQYFEEHPIKTGDKIVSVCNNKTTAEELIKIGTMYPHIKIKVISPLYGKGITARIEEISSEINSETDYTDTHPDDEMFEAHYDASTHVSSEG